MDFKNIYELYDYREVYPKFAYRWFDLCSNAKTWQTDIYNKYVEFCEAAKPPIPLLGVIYLGNYLKKIDGVYFGYGTGNRRYWTGIKLRAEKRDGEVDGELYEQLLHLSPYSMPRTRERKKQSVQALIAGARRTTGEVALLDEDVDRPWKRGTAWHQLKDAYAQEKVIRKFCERHAQRDKAALFKEDDWWACFDAFTLQLKLKPCKLARLFEELRYELVPGYDPKWPMLTNTRRLKLPDVGTVWQGFRLLNWPATEYQSNMTEL